MAINKPSPYVPSFLRAAISGSRPISLTWGDVADTNIASTASFRYDSSGRVVDARLGRRELLPEELTLFLAKHKKHRDKLVKAKLAKSA